MRFINKILLLIFVISNLFTNLFAGEGQLTGIEGFSLKSSFIIGVIFGAVSLFIFWLFSKYYKFGLKARLLGGVSSMIILSIGMNIFSIVSFHGVNQKVGEITNYVVPITNIVSKNTEFHIESYALIDGFYRTKDDELIKDFQNISSIITENFSKSIKLSKQAMINLNAEKNKKYFKRIYDQLNIYTKLHLEYKKQVIDVLNIIKSGEGIDDIDFDETQEGYEDIRHGLSKFTELIHEHFESNMIAINSSEIRTKNILTILSVFFFIYGFFIIWLVGKSSIMLINSIKQTSLLLVKSAGEIKNNSSEIASVSNSIAQESNQQANSVEKTTVSIEQLYKLVDMNLSCSKESNDLLKEVSLISDKGTNSVNELTRSMDEIILSNEEIQELVKIISEIGEKTKIIDEIVFQTKLLSFNASVEAERAGEHGRGFAVVAQEVGNLARISGEAALEISAILKNSLNKVKSVTTKNKISVEKGAGKVTEVEIILKKINVCSKDSASLSTKIFGYSKEQADGLKQISEAMEQLDSGTHRNNSAVSEAAKACNTLYEQTSNMTKIIYELDNKVDGKKN